MYVRLNEVYIHLNKMGQTEEVISAKKLIGDIVLAHYDLKKLEKECWKKVIEMENSLTCIKQKIKVFDADIESLFKEKEKLIDDLMS